LTIDLLDNTSPRELDIKMSSLDCQNCVMLRNKKESTAM